MTDRFPDPPGEDHARTAAITRQERQAADDLVTAARALHTTPSAVILSIIDDHGITDIVKLAARIAELEDDVRRLRERAPEPTGATVRTW